MDGYEICKHIRSATGFYGYKRVGVVVMDLTPANANHQQVFANTDPRNGHLMAVVDKLNKSMARVRCFRQVRT